MYGWGGALVAAATPSQQMRLHGHDGYCTAPAATILPAFCSTRSSSTPPSSSSVPLPAIFSSRASIQILQQPSPNYSPLPRSSSLQQVVPGDSPRVAEAVGDAAAAYLSGATTCSTARNTVPSAQALCNLGPGHAGGAVVNPDEARDDMQPASCHRMVSVGDGRRCGRVRQRRWRRHLEVKDDPGSHTPGCSSQKPSSRLTRSGGYLTPKEEAEFSFHLKEWARIEAEMKLCKTSEDHVDPSRSAVPKASPPGRNADRILLRAMECRERIILSYKRLVVSIASPYEGKGLSLQDLVQEGCIGLLRGAETFDSKRGYKLSTYVYWWIKQAIIKAIAKKSRIVRLPGSMSREAAKIIEANAFLNWRLGRPPTHKEVADMIGTTASRVQLVREKSRQPLSADQPVDKEGMTLKDIIPGPEEATPEMLVIREHVTACLKNLLHSLTEREEHVVRLHYGLNGETQKSCEEIGRLIDLSRERVRQIHWSALRKLREKRSSIESLVRIV